MTLSVAFLAIVCYAMGYFSKGIVIEYKPASKQQPSKGNEGEYTPFIDTYIPEEFKRGE